MILFSVDQVTELLKARLDGDGELDGDVEERHGGTKKRNGSIDASDILLDNAIDEYDQKVFVLHMQHSAYDRIQPDDYAFANMQIS